ncbi:MAG: hypothetical protein KJZ86_13690 [Caldilineaceae bacterium]|nr:hypothetical protein [Caldilineaceae bacterium]HRJ40764.1 hypothetical protein [Caldilineaceae bacterium]
MTNSNNVTLPNAANRHNMRCLTCHTHLPAATRGRLPRYCSDACKQAGYRKRAGGRKATYYEILDGVKGLSAGECERLIDALYNRLYDIGNGGAR